MKIRALCSLSLLIGACSAADDAYDDRAAAVHDLEVQEPDDAGNPALAREGRVELAAPVTARKPTPDPWRIAPAFDKPTPDPWSGCGAPTEDSPECASSHETAAPSVEPATLDP